MSAVRNRIGVGRLTDASTPPLPPHHKKYVFSIEIATSDTLKSIFFFFSILIGPDENISVARPGGRWYVRTKARQQVPRSVCEREERELAYFKRDLIIKK